MYYIVFRKFSIVLTLKYNNEFTISATENNSSTKSEIEENPDVIIILFNLLV